MQPPKSGKPKDLPPTQTLRAQAKGDKQGRKGQPAVPEGDRARMDKSIVKAVLASPLIIPWPTIPTHLQKATMNTLPSLLPQSIVDYHVSRARCHVQDKRKRRKIRRADDAGVELEVTAKDTRAGFVGDEMDVDGAVQAGPGAVQPQAGQKRETPPTTSKPPVNPITVPTDEIPGPRPIKPEVLNHLILGINETIKSLETSISDLKFTLLLMTDALNGNIPSSQFRFPKSGLLPTAPTSTSKLTPTPCNDKMDEIPLEWIIIPLLSINPQSLVSPILQYCATYNALVYQHLQLSKAIKARLGESDWGVIGAEREEVRAVPLGDVEVELAGMVGLRRVACLGIKNSHPGIELLRKLLPKSTLKPPRHSLTIPYPIPTPNLTVQNGSTGGVVPAPKVGYAPMVVKGLSTTMPVDNSARKKVRLEEVRRKRKEGKEKKREGRREKEKEEGRELRDELKGKGKERRKGGAGKAGAGEQLGDV